MTDQELRDNLVTMLLAGHETTANLIGSGLWIGRPVEQPGSRPLAFDGTQWRLGTAGDDLDAIGREPLLAQRRARLARAVGLEHALVELALDVIGLVLVSRHAYAPLGFRRGTPMPPMPPPKNPMKT